MWDWSQYSFLHQEASTWKGYKLKILECTDAWLTMTLLGQGREAHFLGCKLKVSGAGADWDSLGQHNVYICVVMPFVCHMQRKASSL